MFLKEFLLHLTCFLYIYMCSIWVSYTESQDPIIVYLVFFMFHYYLIREIVGKEESKKHKFPF